MIARGAYIIGLGVVNQLSRERITSFFFKVNPESMFLAGIGSEAAGSGRPECFIVLAALCRLSISLVNAV
jgi:hypothetical protein